MASARRGKRIRGLTRRQLPRFQIDFSFGV